MAGAPVLAALLAVMPAPGARAHETDQFTVPSGKEFADLGPVLTAQIHDTLEATVARTNGRIRDGVRNRRDRSHIDWLLSEDHIAAAVFDEFRAVFFLIEGLEGSVHSRATKDRYPGRLAGYREPIRNIYQHVHFALDPRQFWRLWDASTIRLFDTCLGPDKIGHFADMGHRYYEIYRRGLREGLGEAEATARALRFGTDGLIFAETGFVGYLTAGAYSNADLAANYVGFKFYRNLTEPVALRGTVCPPLLEREGDAWRLAAHVRRDSGFFAPYVSDHLNEALNPSLFEKPMRPAVREAVRARADDLLRWYADDNGNQRPREHFDALCEEFSTYWGEDYGHRGTAAELVTIGNTCFDPPPADQKPGERTRNGYTPLHWAAQDGDAERARRLLESGAAVDEPVVSRQKYSAEWGETPLHLAAASGRAATVELLLSHGADAGRAGLRGATPLHRAIAHPQVAALLLARGAPVDARDARGRTPLHWLARYPDLETARLLVSHGASVDGRDHAGTAPLERAARQGHVELMTLLIDAGADVNARSDLGTAPLHAAALLEDPAAARLLLARGADAGARDEFGWTPLHEAARAGRDRVVAALLEAGADPDTRDQYGSIPLHAAARAGHPEAARLLLAAHADLNAPNSAGSTPLHEAVFGEHIAVVILLLGGGADVHARNDLGQTPFDLASWDGNRQVAVLRLWAASAQARSLEQVAEGG